MKNVKKILQWFVGGDEEMQVFPLKNTAHKFPFSLLMIIDNENSILSQLGYLSLLDLVYHSVRC